MWSIDDIRESIVENGDEVELEYSGEKVFISACCHSIPGKVLICDSTGERYVDRDIDAIMAGAIIGGRPLSAMIGLVR